MVMPVTLPAAPDSEAAAEGWLWTTSPATPLVDDWWAVRGPHETVGGPRYVAAMCPRSGGRSGDGSASSGAC
ncbi:hypothetical protein GCM10027601_16860 [Nocardioides ungokensis]